MFDTTYKVSLDMKTLSAAEANREFSRLLRAATEGDEVLILSRGRPVAKLVPALRSPARQRRARAALFRRLRNQTVAGRRRWHRDELYER